jgi:hypothetical protein
VIDVVVDGDVDGDDDDDRKMNMIHYFVERLLQEFVEVLFVVLLASVQLLLRFHH